MPLYSRYIHGCSPGRRTCRLHGPLTDNERVAPAGRHLPLLLSAAIIGLAGCSSPLPRPSPSPSPSPSSSPSPSPTPQYGAVTGTLELVAIEVFPLGGTVFFQRADGETFRTTTSSSGSFSVTVPTGIYTLRARSPMYQDGSQDCRPRTGALTVQVGATTSVVVVCEGK